MHPVELTWFKIIVLIASIVAIGFGITNIVYWNRVRTEDCEEISSSLATMLIWFNVIIIGLALIVFIWSLIRILFTGEEVEKEKPKVNKVYKTTYQTGITSPTYQYATRTITATTPEATSLSPSRNIIGAGTESLIAQEQLYL